TKFDFSGADIRDADFSKTIGLRMSMLVGARHNSTTRWPGNPESHGTRSGAVTRLKLAQGEYQLPPLTLLTEAPPVTEMPAYSDDELEENAHLLEAALSDLGVRGRIVAVRPGPVVTLHELEPASGVKALRVISLSNDIARSMRKVAARVAVIPGRNVIGIELPSRERAPIYLRELFS